MYYLLLYVLSSKYLRENWEKNETKQMPLEPEVSNLVTDGKLRVWLDIDVNNTRDAYQRAVDFVASRNLAYNLTSNQLEELGGSERRRIKETLYANDFEWSQKGRIAINMPPQRIICELWPDIAPLAVENFVALGLCRLTSLFTYHGTAVLSLDVLLFSSRQQRQGR